MAHPLCRRAINRRVSGHPYLWPLDWFAHKYARRPFPRALSLGCGVGNLERVARRRGVCDRILGIDFSEIALERARALAREEGIEGIEYRRGNLDALELPRRAFDAAFFHQSLHHVRSIEKLLARVSGALAAGGLLYLDEWTGPSRYEWTPARLARVRSLYAELPIAWRRGPTVPAPVEASDPSETVRSSAILPAMRLLFDVVEERPYGGHLVSLLLPNLRYDQISEADLAALLTRWLAIEEEDLAEDPSRSYHAVIVARPRKGLGDLAARAAALSLRLRLAARYRIPAAWRILTEREG